MSFGVSDDKSIHSHTEDFSCWVEGWPSQILALPRWYLHCTVPLSVLSIHSLGYLLQRRKYILLLSQSCLCCHKNTRITKNTDKNIQHSYNSKVSLIHTQIPSFSLHDFHRCKLIFWSLAQPGGATQVTLNLIAVLSQGDILCPYLTERIWECHHTEINTFIDKQAHITLCFYSFTQRLIHIKCWLNCRNIEVY